MMKFYRGVICFICLCMLLSMTAFAKDTKTCVFAFKDVKEKAWYYDEVMDAYENGIMVGVSDDSFAPNMTVTREMFVTALSRISMTNVSQYHEHKSSFTDVNIEKWYADAIEWAVSNNIVYGITEDKFGVGEAVTREQIAAFIDRFLDSYLYKIENSDTPAEPFEDECSKYAKDAVERMRLTGLVSGRSEGEFAPKETATRAEVAAILMRLYTLIKEPEFCFDFDASGLSQVGVFCDVYTKDVIITEPDEIEEFIDYLNNTPIERAEYIGEAVGWDHKISLYNNGGSRVFTVYFTTSFFIINDCLYLVESDYFQPLVDAVK